MDNEFTKYILRRARHGMAVLLFSALAVVTLRGVAPGQDQDDPPGRAARLGYMEGSVSFQPAGENEWVQAVPNRPMTIGDQIWADRDSRAEVQLGSATIRLGANTGFSFLNLDDRTVQIQLSAGTLNLRVRRLERDALFEVDTPNQAFSVLRPGSYRVEASEDGNYSVVTIREGEGESTGNGQTYTIHSGQRVTLSGTNALNADMEEIGDPDDFDSWAYNRDHHDDDSRSGRYVSHDVVGYEDLDDHGDWRPSGEYGNVWYPRVGPEWAPYHEGHWAWVDPWGWTWVDDEPWGYAPFHYGRWASIDGRWGWIPGPVEAAPVYAPALVVFVGGGGPGFGGNVAWFPLGPREVFVPSYPVSQAYVNRVNISNTTVTQTTVTNVYNTTIVNNNTTITNVNYANRNVRGAVTAVPQNAFASAQPVAKAAVAVTPQQLAAAPIARRAAVAPTPQAVMGAHASTAGHVAAPPQAVRSRQVIAKATPPPPPPPFAARQQALAAHPGQPMARQELAKMRPAAAAAPVRPMVKQAPPGKPATAVAVKPGSQPNRPGNQPAANERPGGNAAQPNRPGSPPPANQPNRPGNPSAPNERPGATAQPNRPQPNQPAPGNRPEAQPPARNDRPPSAQPNRPEPNRPQPNQPAPENRPQPNRPAPPPAPNERPPAAQPNNRPEPNRPEPQPNNRPQPNQPAPANRPQPQPNRPAQPPERPQPPANDRPPQRTPPPEARPAPKPQERPPAKPQTPEEKRQEQQKRDEKPQPPG